MKRKKQKKEKFSEYKSFLLLRPLFYNQNTLHCYILLLKISHLIFHTFLSQFSVTMKYNLPE